MGRHFKRKPGSPMASFTGYHHMPKAINKSCFPGRRLREKDPDFWSTIHQRQHQLGEIHSEWVNVVCECVVHMCVYVCAHVNRRLCSCVYAHAPVSKRKAEETSETPARRSCLLLRRSVLERALGPYNQLYASKKAFPAKEILLGDHGCPRKSKAHPEI